MTRLRKVAAIALIFSLTLTIPAAKVFAFTPDDAVTVCVSIEGQDLGCQQGPGGLGVNGPGELSPNQLMLLWYFVIAAWALNEEILESGPSIEIRIIFGPDCTNCNDGFKIGRIVTDPLPIG